MLHKNAQTADRISISRHLLFVDVTSVIPDVRKVGFARGAYFLIRLAPLSRGTGGEK